MRKQIKNSTKLLLIFSISLVVTGFASCSVPRPKATFCTINTKSDDGKLYKLCFVSPDDFDSQFRLKPGVKGLKIIYPNANALVYGYDWQNPKGEIINIPGLKGGTAIDPLSMRRVLNYIQEMASQK